MPATAPSDADHGRWGRRGPRSAKFSRFHHMEADGLGLRLSIVQGIITKLNGVVGVESEEGKGSKFWFELPAAPQ